jgi:hypothetical protein
MGAWGDKIFENDTAMDFVGGLAEDPADAPAVLREALRVAAETPPGEYLDADEGGDALAAAAIVSAARGGSPVDRSDPSVDEYLGKIAPHVSDELAPLAVTAIDRVVTGNGEDSELVELWEEAGELDAWRREPLAVREHLAA